MRRPDVGIASTLAMCLVLLASAAVQGSDPAASAPAGSLAATLLTADDLPAGMAPTGVGDASTFNTDAGDFAANDGAALVEQTWEASTQAPVYRVFDFRFQFPTAEAAQAYLDAAEPVLSESGASGLTLVTGDTGIGDGYRHYSREAISDGQTVELHNVLFRNGSVVAKVFVGGYGTTADDVMAIAQAAYARIAAVTPPDTIAAPVPDATSGAATPTLADPSAGLHQWATTATASTNYGSGSQWAAQSAAGEPDVTGYADSQLAWVPKAKDGTTDWLDLRYDHAVIPTAVSIHESFSPGFVTKVEAYHTADGAWVTLWEGTDPTPPDVLGVFSPPLTQTGTAVDRIRVTIDTDIPDYNEIDAVELVGTPPG